MLDKLAILFSKQPVTPPQHPDAAQLIRPQDTARFALYKAGPMTLLLESGNECDAGVIRGNFEGDQRKALFALVNKMISMGYTKPHFIDCGAHWGYYSLCALYSGLFGDITAFEADPFNYSQLRSQLMLNNATVKVKAHNFAITQAPMMLPWTLSAEHLPGNRAGVGVYELGELRIEGRTLDSFFAQPEKAIVAKIDVEGHEREVLRGARNLLTNTKAVLQIESVDHVEDIGQILAEYGYRKLRVIDIDHYFTNIDGLQAD